MKKVRIVPSKKLKITYSQRSVVYMQAGAKYVRQVSSMVKTRIHSLKMTPFSISSKESFSCLFQLQSATDEADTESNSSIFLMKQIFFYGGQKVFVWDHTLEDVNIYIAEAQECLKKEQSNHLISISEVEKREENLRNALGVQRQSVDDFEKALREMRVECAETKYNAGPKMAEVHALVASLEENSLEVEIFLHVADANWLKLLERVPRLKGN